jgi:hypothetical protein
MSLSAHRAWLLQGGPTQVFTLLAKSSTSRFHALIV